jgi:hypothetical protein
LNIEKGRKGANSFSRSHHAVIRVYDAAGDVIETHEHNGDLKQCWSHLYPIKTDPKYQILPGSEFFAVGFYVLPWDLRTVRGWPV